MAGNLNFMSPLLHLPFIPRKAGSAQLLGRYLLSTGNPTFPTFRALAIPPASRGDLDRGAGGTGDGADSLPCYVTLDKAFLFPRLEVAVPLGPEPRASAAAEQRLRRWGFYERAVSELSAGGKE